MRVKSVAREHCAILLTFIKLPFVFKTFVLSNFEWPLKTGSSVYNTSGDVQKLREAYCEYSRTMEKITNRKQYL